MNLGPIVAQLKEAQQELDRIESEVFSVILSLQSYSDKINPTISKVDQLIAGTVTSADKQMINELTAAGKSLEHSILLLSQARQIARRT